MSGNNNSIETTNGWYTSIKHEYTIGPFATLEETFIKFQKNLNTIKNNGDSKVGVNQCINGFTINSTEMKAIHDKHFKNITKEYKDYNSVIYCIPDCAQSNIMPLTCDNLTSKNSRVVAFITDSETIIFFITLQISEGLYIYKPIVLTSDLEIYAKQELIKIADDNNDFLLKTFIMEKATFSSYYEGVKYSSPIICKNFIVTTEKPVLKTLSPLPVSPIYEDNLSEDTSSSTQQIIKENNVEEICYFFGHESITTNHGSYYNIPIPNSPSQGTNDTLLNIDDPDLAYILNSQDIISEYNNYFNTQHIYNPPPDIDEVLATFENDDFSWFFDLPDTIYDKTKSTTSKIQDALSNQAQKTQQDFLSSFEKIKSSATMKNATTTLDILRSSPGLMFTTVGSAAAGIETSPKVQQRKIRPRSNPLTDHYEEVHQLKRNRG